MTTAMNTRTRKAPFVTWTVAALLVAAVGIVVQIVGGNVPDYPLVPPGAVILLVAAGFVWFAPWRWSPVVGVLAGVFQLVGLFAAGQSPRLVSFDPVGDSLGLWLQLLALVVAVVTGTAAVVPNYRTGTSRG